MEEGGSRVCTNCFGLKVDIDPYYPKSPLTSPNGDSNGGSVSPRSSGKFSAIQQRKFVVIRRGKKSQVASDISSTTTTSSTSDTEPADETSVMFKKLQEFEQQQLPKYEEAYKTMRAIIPPHITKTKLKTIIKEGVPKDIAHRIWETKALWLICMHKDDIRKVHVGDLRSKYNFHTLDLTELRAVWYALPDWNELHDPAKAEWKEGLKMKMDDMAYKLSTGQIDISETRNAVYTTKESLKIYDTNVEITPRFGKSASYAKKATVSPDSNADINTTPNSGLSPLLRQMNATRTNTFAPPAPVDNGFSRDDEDDTPRRKISFDEEIDEVDEDEDESNGSSFKSINKTESVDDYESLDSLLLESKTYSATHSAIASNNTSFVTLPNNSFRAVSAMYSPAVAPATTFTFTKLDKTEEDDSDDCSVGIKGTTYVDFGEVSKSFVASSLAQSAAWNETSSNTSKSSRGSHRSIKRLLAPPISTQDKVLTKLNSVSDDDDSIGFSPVSVAPTPEPPPSKNIRPFATPASAGLGTISTDTLDNTSNSKGEKSPGTPGDRSSFRLSGPYDYATLRKLLLRGRAQDAEAYLDRFQGSSVLPSKAQATKLLMECVREADGMEVPVATFALLLDRLGADVNDLSCTGRSPLSVLFANKELGSYLISRGADVLLEDKNGSFRCPLTHSFEFRMPWMIREFETSGREQELLDGDDVDRIKRYASYLIMGGYFTKVEKIILDGIVDFTPREASEILRRCCDTFETLENPTDTFELLLALDGDKSIIKRYVTGLILVGYGIKAGQIISTGHVEYTPDEATELLSSCSGNFSQMHEPMETFELLERLGAEIL